MGEKVFLFSFLVLLEILLVHPSLIQNPEICDSKSYSDINFFKFCDSSLPYNVRVKDLIHRMRWDVKVENSKYYLWQNKMLDILFNNEKCYFYKFYISKLLMRWDHHY